MSIRLRQIITELGSAAGVLALYMLVLLAPLHQASAQQRDLARLGYQSEISWSVCTSVPDSGRSDRDLPTAAKCPLAASGKPGLAAVLPSMAMGQPMRVATAMDFVAIAEIGPPDAMQHPGQPRGPPAAA